MYNCPLALKNAWSEKKKKKKKRSKNVTQNSTENTESKLAQYVLNVGYASILGPIW